MRRSQLALVTFALTFLISNGLALALPGQVLDEQKISSTDGGFGGMLVNQDQFGAALAPLGDLDGDGVAEMIVGAPRDSDGGTATGAVWVLFMNSDGTVASEVKISATSGGLGASLGIVDQFGMGVAALGDLDGDEVPDLAVGADGDDDGGGNRGAVYILFMNTDGTVKGEQKISSTSGGFAGSLNDGDRFGSSVASIGDLDGDTVVDIAVGAPITAGGGVARGAAWILLLNSDGTVKFSTRIDDTTPGLSGNVDDLSLFGSSVSAFGDIDGDLVEDLVVGAAGDGENGGARGAVWVVNLDAGGAAVGAQKINDSNGGFAGTLDDNDAFGAAVAGLPDIDGDGVEDLAVGATGDDTGGSDRGQVYILFMNTDSTVKGFRRINAPGSGFVGPLGNSEQFGNAAASLGDFDGDFIADIAVGQRFSNDGGTNRGAAWMIFLDGAPLPMCGDGDVGPDEECDDGNTDNGDCCDENCLFEPSESSCSDGDICNGDETCDGAGTCDPGIPLDCDDSNECTTDSCDASLGCQSTDAAPGTPCLDGDICNGDEACDGTGTCESGTPLVCDDGQACTQDTCDPIDGCSVTTGPSLACNLPEKGNVTVGDNGNDDKNKLTWKWLKGDTPFADFGDPIGTHTYALCIYDTVADTPTLVSEIVVPPSTNWSVRGADKGYKYKDSAALAAGVKSMVMTAGVGTKAKVIVKAKGADLPLPGPVGATYFAQDSSVILQLVGGQGKCWSTGFVTSAQKNDASTFKDRFP